MNFSTPVSQLTKVGKTTARLLSRLGLKTAKDLLFYFPFRYEDFRRIVLVKDLRAGDTITVRVKIELLANKRSFRSRKTVTEGLMSDESGSLRVVWFNQPYLIKTLRPGETIFLSGKVKTDMLGAELVNPTYEKVGKETNTHTARLVPIYPTTAGLTQKQIRFLVSQVIDLADKIEEWLPEEILEQEDMVPLSAALRGVHFPIDEKDFFAASRRLKFGELFLLQLRAERARRNREKEKAPAINFPEEVIKTMVDGLPFKLTKSQKIAAWEILQDLKKNSPMNRLLSGDVGSGKTVVAALATWDVVWNDFQVAILAPTEILAVQHFITIKKILYGKAKIALLTGSQSEYIYASNDDDFIQTETAISKKDLLKKIIDGEAQIIVGTHALLSEKVKFKNLGLVVVDEQHRFGVEQRKTLKKKGKGVHFLSLTATPIPRSLALVLYGDLELSTIPEMPIGRKPIITRLVEPEKRGLAYDFIRSEVKKGRQAFVICPLIEQKESGENKDGENGDIVIENFSLQNDRKTVLDEYKKLSEEIFSDLRVAYLHGRMPAKEKELTMDKMRRGEVDVLISTSVVEVGVDIPNASIMMIEGAEHFGLAQLHQFRGRVGRSIYQSFCLLFTEKIKPNTQERLQFFAVHNDGFKLAEKDLATRGPGQVYGTVQHGFGELKLAKLTDYDIIKLTREWVKKIAPRIEQFPILFNKIKYQERGVHWE